MFSATGTLEKPIQLGELKSNNEEKEKKEEKGKKRGERAPGSQREKFRLMNPNPEDGTQGKKNTVSFRGQEGHKRKREV